MTIPVNEFRGTPAAPKVETWPGFTAADLTVGLGASVPADGALNVIWATIGVPALGVGENVVPYTRRKVGWEIRPALAAGGALQIRTSLGGTGFTFWKEFPLYGVDTNLELGLLVPAWTLVFSIRNHDLATAQAFTGYIWMET